MASSREDLVIQSISPLENGFYGKRLDYAGIPIKSPLEVADEALFQAWERLNMMLCHAPNITANLSSSGAQLHIIGKNQSTSDLPENQHLKGSLIDGMDIDLRTRGTGGLHASCGEENLLRLPLDRYHGSDICVHEFAHTILSYGLCDEARRMVFDQYKTSVEKGLWEGCYAAKNQDEFFAELSMWYFGTQGDSGLINPSPIKGAEWLRFYDSEAFAILNDIFSGRFSIRPIYWQKLWAMAAVMEHEFFSQRSTIPTLIRIINESQSTFNVFWLNYEGERIFYSKIFPGDTFAQQTYDTHPWLVTDLQDRGVRIYVASPHPGVALIS